MTLDTHAVPATAARSADRGTPLSPAQQAALLPERLARTAVANVFVALEFPAALADGVAERATAVVAGHEILRTVYPDDRRVPYQRVEAAPATVVEVVEIDAPALPTALMADAGHRFDLAHALPIRLRLYRFEDRAVLSIAVHPVAADDRTMDLLAELLFADTAELPRQYRDFASAQMKLLAAEDASLAYWKQRLAGLPDQLLPVRERPRTPRSARAVVRIPAAVLSGLPGDPEAVLVALIAEALRELGAPGDVPIGIAEPARPEGAEQVLGSFANYLVVRVDSERGSAPARSIGAAARLLGEARAHAATRIEKLTHLLRGPGGAAKGGLFQVLAGVRQGVLALQTSDGPVREIARAAARPHGVDLIVDAVADAEGWTVTVDLAEELSRRHSVERFARVLAETAESWSAAPESARGAGAVQPCGWFVADEDDLALDEPAISGLGGAPVTDAERAVADVLREILEWDADDEIGREDNFFALGGDSVAALRFVTLLAERGHILDVQQVFEFPEVHEMAANLRSADAAAPAAAAPAPEVAPLAASGLDAAALAALAGKFGGR